jgi:hypothetical protein
MRAVGKASGLENGKLGAKGTDKIWLGRGYG